MRRAITVVFAAVAIVAIDVACNPFAPDQSVILGVQRLDAPASISAGSSLTVVLTVTTGGCLGFDHIEAERAASGVSLTAWGRDASKGRNDIVCPAVIISEPHSYQLDPPFQSPFTVTVNRGTLSPLTATVQIQ
jgi:hypothetical protein